MQDNVPPMKYMELLAEWATSLANNQSAENSQEIFRFQQAMNEQNHQIPAQHSFDNRIEQAACFLLKTLQYSQLQGGLEGNSKRKGLSKTAEFLYVERLISREGIMLFKAEIKSGIIDKIAEFLQATHNHQTSKEALHEIWSKFFIFSSEQLQQLLKKQKAMLQEYPFLFRLAQISIELSIHHAKSNYFIKFLRQGEVFFNIPEVIEEQRQLKMTDLLIQIAKQKSLFLGERYQTLIPLLKELPSCLSKALSLQDIRSLRYSGPLFDRSLLGESIELSLNFSGASSTFLVHLERIYQKGKADWLKEWQLGKEDKLLILSVHKLHFEEAFNIPNVKLLRVYFFDEQRQNCVQAIARYTKQTDILIFCVLVKTWWKNIESNKKLGKIILSSHALMLMAIFFLLQSSQILPIKYSSGKLSITSRNIYSLLVGFLQYYGPKGNFYNCRDCIGINKGSEVADANFIINLRGCSCGETKIWLSRGYSDIVEQIFQSSRSTLVSCNPQQINSLFSKK